MGLIQWLNDLPVGTGAIIVIGGGIALAIIGTLIVNAYFTPAQLVSNNIIGGFKYAFLSSVYAGYIGLLLFGVYQKYDDVRADIIVEVNALTTLDRVTAAVKKHLSDPERIKKFIRNLRASPEEQAYAINELRRSGAGAALARGDDL